MALDNIGEKGQIKRRIYQRVLPENPSKDYYYILRETGNAEPLLIEYGFIDNKNDLQKLTNNLEDYVEGVVKAIADYTGYDYTPPVLNDYYTVQRGDTLYSIARKYNTTVNQIIELNNLNSTILSIGQKLLIQEPNNNPEQETTTYIVQKGDSLWSISRKYNTTVDELIELNNLNTINLQIGDKLIVPGKEENTYIVKSGDTLWSIARTYNVTVQDIKDKNNLISNLLSIGQQLIIP